MGSFEIICPQCGGLLEADEKYSAKIACCEKCDYHFTLWRPEENLPVYEDFLLSVDPVTIAKYGLPLSFTSPFFSKIQLDLLLDLKDSKRLFCLEHPLLHPKLHDQKDINLDHYFPWTMALFGSDYYMSRFWNKYNREYLFRWLRQMNVSYKILKDVCQGTFTFSHKQNQHTVPVKTPHTSLHTEDQTKPSYRQVEAQPAATPPVIPVKQGKEEEKPTRKIRTMDSSPTKTDEKPKVEMRTNRAHVSIGEAIASVITANKQEEEKTEANVRTTDSSKNIGTGEKPHGENKTNCCHEKIENDPTNSQFTFQDPSYNLSHAKPSLLIIEEIEYQINTWKEVLIQLCVSLLNTKRKQILALRDKRVSESTKRIFLKSSSAGMIFPKKISDDLWMESNFSAQTIIKLSIELAGACKEDLSRILVYYSHRSTEKKKPQITVKNKQQVIAVKKPMVEAVEQTTKQRGNYSLDFGKMLCFNCPPQDLRFTKPNLFSIGNNRYQINNWKDVLRNLCSHLLATKEDHILALRGKKLSKSTKRIIFKTSTEGLIFPIKIAENLWVESNFPSQIIITIAIELARVCEEDLSDIRVFYSPRSTDNSEPQISQHKQHLNEWCFVKRVDWSTFNHGITVPISFHENFRVHLSFDLGYGSFHPITVQIMREKFTANIFAPKFTDQSRQPVVQFRWSKDSAVAKYLQARYCELYNAFLNDKNDVSIPSESFEVRAAGEKDCFEFLISDHAISEKQPKEPEPDPIPMPDQPVLPGKEQILEIETILAKHFSNGYRIDSPIELMRFRKFSSEDLGEKITLSDDELRSHISLCGTLFDGKIYVVSESTKEKVKRLAEDYFASGAQAIFQSEFYVKNESWLFNSSIISENMLVSILHNLFPTMYFSQTYFGYTDASIFATIKSEILRVWEENILQTYEQLAERLQYIPIDRIKYTLGQCNDFIWNSEGTFSHFSKVYITNEECESIRAVSMRECNKSGYVSISSLPLMDICERNEELSLTAVHNAVYRICLSDKFDKKGKIVTWNGDVNDALTLTKKYCRTIDQCSLDDLLNFEKDLTGEMHRWVPMEAGYAVLVRIDKDLFLAEKYVHFDTDAIDEAIALFVTGNYLSLKSFTTFGPFPDCGQTWNLFLLESYCRRFSQKFRFDTPSVNSRNAGAVIRKKCVMNYTEVMTDAVANSEIPLNKSAVGTFLYESGYTGRSTNAKVSEIIDKAKAIRKIWI